MLRNYIRTALHNLLNNKSSSIINILGLTIGLCSCILIGIYIRNELNYDRFQETVTGFSGLSWNMLLMVHLHPKREILRA